MRMLGLLAIWMGGCTWVSQGDIEARRGELDDDQDGYIAGEDCDDNDPTISPGAEEVWYDGIDSDCLLDDDFDADGDGYVEAQYAGMVTEGVATSGELPSGDCDDANDIIHPGGADAWYDGVDTDCAGNDDYDQDGDGYVDEDYGGLVTEYVDGSGSLPPGDCDDVDADINPSAEDDWYDGVDTDCGGEDDYDQDADGYVDDAYQGLATAYAPGTGSLPGGDCDDTNEYVYTGAKDTAYDGLDWDCAGDDDYDQDGDGYVPDIYEGLTTVGVAESGSLPAGDCDDADAEINPGQVEVLSDNRDLDCDQGGASSGSTSFTAAGLDGFSNWDTPFKPEFAENVQGVYLSMAALQLKQGTTSYYDSALAIAFDPTAPFDGPTDTYVWLKHVVDPSSYDLTPGHDFVLTNEHLFGVTGLVFDSQRSFRLGGFDLVYGVNGISGEVLSTGTTTAPFVDMSIALAGDGTLYGIGCDDEDGVLQYFRASLDSAVDSDIDADAVVVDAPMDACELTLTDNDATGLLFSTQSAGLVVDSFDLSDDTPVLVQESVNGSRSPQTISAVEDEWVVVADPGAVYIISSSGATYTEALGESPQSAEASVAPDGSLIVAYVDGDGMTHILHGDPAAGMDHYEVQTDFAATEAVAWAESTGTYLMVAIIGPSDVAYGAAAL